MFPLRDSVRARTFPFVNYVLVAVNVLVFTWEVKINAMGELQPFLESYSLIPARFFTDPFFHLRDVFSAMFLHGSWGHVISNMWFLLIFGDNVEDNLGHFKYLIYYLVTGLGAAAAQMLAHPASSIPMIGASGAVAGVLGGYIVLYPHARILTLVVFVFFVRLIEVPAYFFLGLWFLVQAVNGVGSLAVAGVREVAGGVAWWAHAGGFAAGFMALPFFRRRR